MTEKNVRAIWQWILLMALVLLAGCGAPPNPAEEARRQMSAQGITFDEETFLRTAFNGDEAKVQLFLQAGIDLNLRQKPNGATALRIAAQKNHLPVARLLLSKGADPNIPMRDGTTPLMATIFTNQVEMAKLLLQSKADVNAKAYNGLTPLMVAAEYGTPEMVALLKDAGADLNATLQDGSKSVLDFATGGQKTEVAELLAKAGALPGKGGPASVDPNSKGSATVTSAPQ